MTLTLKASVNGRYEATITNRNTGEVTIVGPQETKSISFASADGQEVNYTIFEHYLGDQMSTTERVAAAEAEKQRLADEALARDKTAAEVGMTASPEEGDPAPAAEADEATHKKNKKK